MGKSLPIDAVTHGVPTSPQHYLAGLPKLVVFDHSLAEIGSSQHGTSTRPDVLPWIAKITGISGSAAIWNCTGISTRMPRGTAWADLPVITDRKLKVLDKPWARRMRVFDHDKPLSLYTVECDVVIPQATCFAFILIEEGGAVMSRDQAARTLERDLRIIRSLRGSEDAAAVLISPLHGPRTTTLHQLTEEVAAYEAVPRFLMNYEINATALLGRALSLAWDATPNLAPTTATLARFGKENDNADTPLDQQSMQSLDQDLRQTVGAFFIDALKSPLGLQVLYRIARGACDDVDWRKRPVKNDRYVITALLSNHIAEAVAGAPDDDPDKVRWKGTGAREDVPILKETIGQCLFDLMVFGLIDTRDTDATTRVVIGERGRKFLDLIHPDMEDADMLSRWGLLEGRPATEAVATSMNSWLLRNFRKTKARLDDLV